MDDNERNGVGMKTTTKTESYGKGIHTFSSSIDFVSETCCCNEKYYSLLRVVLIYTCRLRIFRYYMMLCTLSFLQSKHDATTTIKVAVAVTVQTKK